MSHACRFRDVCGCDGAQGPSCPSWPYFKLPGGIRLHSRASRRSEARLRQGAYVAKSRVLWCVDRMSFHTSSMLPLGPSGRAASPVAPAELGAAASRCRNPSAGCGGGAAGVAGPAAEAMAAGRLQQAGPTLQQRLPRSPQGRCTGQQSLDAAGWQYQCGADLSPAPLPWRHAAMRRCWSKCLTASQSEAVAGSCSRLLARRVGGCCKLQLAPHLAALRMNPAGNVSERLSSASGSAQDPR